MCSKMDGQMPGKTSETQKHKSSVLRSYVKAYASYVKADRQ